MLCLTGLLISFIIFPDGPVPYLLALGSSDTLMLSRSVSLFILDFFGARPFFLFSLKY